MHHGSHEYVRDAIGSSNGFLVAPKSQAELVWRSVEEQPVLVLVERPMPSSGVQENSGIAIGGDHGVFGIFSRSQAIACRSQANYQLDSVSRLENSCPRVALRSVNRSATFAAAQTAKSKSSMASARAVILRAISNAPFANKTSETANNGAWYLTRPNIMHTIIPVFTASQTTGRVSPCSRTWAIEPNDTN